MLFKLILCERFRNIFVFTVVSVLLLNSVPSVELAFAQSTGLYSYEFIVDKSGHTIVNIVYQSSEESGSSWVLVPNFLEWRNITTKGVVTEWSLLDPEDVLGDPYYFYQVLSFSFVSEDSEYELNIQFNMSSAAMIIEPKGIFFSSQIAFEKGNKIKAKVVLPDYFIVRSNEVLALGDLNVYPPSLTDQSSQNITFDDIPQTENRLRIEIGFNTGTETLDLLEYESGVFVFETVARYAEYAQGILELYNRTYDYFVELFNVTLESARIKFFLPDFDLLLAIGGYVPFTSTEIGDIHINIVFTRYVEGYIEVIALHELIHHFLWKSGISPETLLWFHEGMAQYISIEIASKMGFEGVTLMKQEIETGISALKQVVGDNFRFLNEWSPSRQPQDIGSHYLAAYYVVSRLSDPRNGLEYYAEFFSTINGETIDGNTDLGFFLSQAAGETVVETLNQWGFGIPDIYQYSHLLIEVKEIVDGIEVIYEPYRSLADLLYRLAFLNAQNKTETNMYVFLTATLFIARFAPLLTVITTSGLIFITFLIILKFMGIFSDS